MSEKLRLPAEESYAAELRALAAGDDGHRPPGWVLSPRLVVTYLMGGKAADGAVISPKYVGDRRLIETVHETHLLSDAVRIPRLARAASRHNR